MSTKIYTGKKLKAMSAVELLAYCKSLKPKFDKAVQNRIESMMVGIAVDEYDKRTLGLSKETSKLGGFAIDQMNDLIKKEAMSTETSIVLFPMKTKTLAIFYGDNEYQKIWEKMKGVEDYCYYNNTDEPDGMTAKEWKQRQKDWEEVLLEDSGVPAQEGFSFTFTDDNIYMYVGMTLLDRDKCAKHIPSLESRIKSAAETLIDANVSGTFLEVEKYMSSEERKTLMATKIKKLDGKLVATLTIKDIFEKEWR